jgi:hypothetical protein
MRRMEGADSIPPYGFSEGANDAEAIRKRSE